MVRTQVNLTEEVQGILPAANGGTGAGTLAAGALLVGGGTGVVGTLAPGTDGNSMMDTGTTWVSSAITLTSKAPTTAQLIVPGYAGYVANEYECKLGVETEIGLGATLEIG